MNWEPIIIGVIAALPPSLVGVAALLQAIKAHNAVNSKMDALLELTRKSAFAEGQKEEKEKHGVHIQ